MTVIPIVDVITSPDTGFSAAVSQPQESSVEQVGHSGSPALLLGQEGDLSFSKIVVFLRRNNA